MVTGTAVVKRIAVLVLRPDQVWRGLETATHPVASRTDHQLLALLTEPVLGGGQSHPAPAVSALHLDLTEVRRVPGAGTEAGPAPHLLPGHHQPLPSLAGAPGEQRLAGPGLRPVDLTGGQAGQLSLTQLVSTGRQPPARRGESDLQQQI